jgi:pyridoxamine 5'-phosphate oxidase
VREVGKRFAGGEIPRPEFWGGFLVRPERIEFWQGQAARLHDRFAYTRAGDGWEIRRLAP